MMTLVSYVLPTAVAFIVATLVCLIFATLFIQPNLPTTLRNRRICLLIAHPDDEAMFFAPTVLALAHPMMSNHLQILCLSSGDADGLGAVRKKELVKSAMTLGLRDEDDVFVMESPDFPDSLRTPWSTPKVAKLLTQIFLPTLAATEAAGTPPEPTIDVLLTFDGGGVSGHPNHVSLWRGARSFLYTLRDACAASAGGGRARAGDAPPTPTPCPLALYTLRTVGIHRKYMGALDVLATLAGRKLSVIGQGGWRQRLVFVNGIRCTPRGGGVWSAWVAMVKAHRSQMVWFRWGWISLSRYMYVNELDLEDR